MRHANDPGLVGGFERALFPPFQHVLQADVVEFAPYVFQLLSQLIETHPSGSLPSAYVGIFPALLVPALWDRQANVTPLVRLLEAFLRKAPAEIAGGGYLQGILGVFQKLVSSRAQDHQGFFVLNALVSSLALPAWIDQLPAVWGILFQRLQTSKTTKFVRCLVVFVSSLAVKHGPSVVADTMAKVQPGIFEMVLAGPIADAVGGITGEMETKVVAVASARFLSESSSLIANDAGWAKLLTNVVTLLEKPTDAGGDGGDAADADAELEEMEAKAGYSAAYNSLANAKRVEVDPCAEVTDVKTHVARTLATASGGMPGRMRGLIQGGCPPEVQNAVAGYCQAAGVMIN